MAENLSSSDVKILPTTVRVRGIDIMGLLVKIQDITREADLNEIRGFNIGFNFGGISLSLSWQDSESFNISSSDPEVLLKFVESIKNSFDVQ